MRKWFNVKAAKKRSIKATERAIRGWKVRHARRDAMALKDPIRVGGKIVRRIIVIDNESLVKERSFYQFDRSCDTKRKLNELGLSPRAKNTNAVRVSNPKF